MSELVFNLSRSGHIPVLTAVAESPSGQVLCVESHHATVRIAEELQPMKVMFLNTAGGLVDRQGNVSVKSEYHWLSYDLSTPNHNPIGPSRLT